MPSRTPIDGLTAASFRHPRRMLALALAVLAAGGWLASRLEIRSGLEELLPSDLPSVVELKQLARRVGGDGTVLVNVESLRDRADLPRAEALALELARDYAAFGPDVVRSVEVNLEPAERWASLGVKPGSIDGALRFYVGRYLADDILVKADRASMAASLELRAPFLDTEVVEFAARLPCSMKLGLFSTKRILRRAVKGLVPEPIRVRAKKGFGIPVAAWIRGPLRPLFEDLFSPASLARSGVFAPGPLRALLDRHLSGKADLRKPLWTVAAFLLWQRHHGVRP